MVQGFDACFVSYAFWQLARLGRQADLVSSHGHVLSIYIFLQAKRSLIHGEGSGMESHHLSITSYQKLFRTHEENRHRFTTSPGKMGSSLDSRHIASIGMPRSGSHPNAWSCLRLGKVVEEKVEIKSDQRNQIRTHEIHKHSSKQPRRVNSKRTLFWGVDGHLVSLDLNQN